MDRTEWAQEAVHEAQSHKRLPTIRQSPVIVLSLAERRKSDLVGTAVRNTMYILRLNRLIKVTEDGIMTWCHLGGCSHEIR